MKDIFKIGDRKEWQKVVENEDTATFDAGNVHPVYATFALGRDAEWCCRLFVLEMKGEDEEGIGTFLSIEHVSPALVGSNIVIKAEVIKLERNEIVCQYHVYCGERLIAHGEQGQKILKKNKLERIFSELG
jgi:fluoroacetyl-CoA thioesterase